MSRSCIEDRGYASERKLPRQRCGGGYYRRNLSFYGFPGYKYIMLLVNIVGERERPNLGFAVSAQLSFSKARQMYIRVAVTCVLYIVKYFLLVRIHGYTLRKKKKEKNKKITECTCNQQEKKGGKPKEPKKKQKKKQKPNIYQTKQGEKNQTKQNTKQHKPTHKVHPGRGRTAMNPGRSISPPERYCW